MPSSLSKAHKHMELVAPSDGEKFRAAVDGIRDRVLGQRLRNTIVAKV